jgi:hypothetical protein
MTLWKILVKVVPTIFLNVNLKENQTYFCQGHQFNIQFQDFAPPIEAGTGWGTNTGQPPNPDGPENA